MRSPIKYKIYIVIINCIYIYCSSCQIILLIKIAFHISMDITSPECDWCN